MSFGAGWSFPTKGYVKGPDGAGFAGTGDGDGAGYPARQAAGGAGGGGRDGKGGRDQGRCATSRDRDDVTNPPTEATDSSNNRLDSLAQEESDASNPDNDAGFRS